MPCFEYDIGMGKVHEAAVEFRQGAEQFAGSLDDNFRNLENNLDQKFNAFQDFVDNNIPAYIKQVDRWLEKGFVGCVVATTIVGAVILVAMLILFQLVSGPSNAPLPPSWELEVWGPQTERPGEIPGTEGIVGEIDTLVGELADAKARKELAAVPDGALIAKDPSEGALEEQVEALKLKVKKMDLEKTKWETTRVMIDVYKAQLEGGQGVLATLSDGVLCLLILTLFLTLFLQRSKWNSQMMTLLLPLFFLYLLFRNFSASTYFVLVQLGSMVGLAPSVVTLLIQFVFFSLVALTISRSAKLQRCFRRGWSLFKSRILGIKRHLRGE